MLRTTSYFLPAAPPFFSLGAPLQPYAAVLAAASNTSQPLADDRRRPGIHTRGHSPPPLRLPDPSPQRYSRPRAYYLAASGFLRAHQMIPPSGAGPAGALGAASAAAATLVITATALSGRGIKSRAQLKARSVYSSFTRRRLQQPPPLHHSARSIIRSTTAHYAPHAPGSALVDTTLAVYSSSASGRQSSRNRCAISWVLPRIVSQIWASGSIE